MYRPLERQGFCPGDIVWTPTKRKARLCQYRATEGYWDAHYLDEMEHKRGVVLQPKHIHLVDDE